MAAIFCLLGMTLCGLSSNGDSNHLTTVENSGHNSVLPLNAQLITVPRVYISPCPESFRYTFNGKEWFALVVIRKPQTKGKISKIKVHLSVGFHLSSVSLFF